MLSNSLQGDNVGALTLGSVTASSRLETTHFVLMVDVLTLKATLTSLVAKFPS